MFNALCGGTETYQAGEPIKIITSWISMVELKRFALSKRAQVNAVRGNAKPLS
jgi:hypothetical protein